MKPSPESEQNLERFVSAALRDLPARRAPRSLEQRVLAELERRAALPWWSKSFVHWPIVARATFVLASAGLVKVMLMAAVWIMAGFDRAQFAQAFAPQFAWLGAMRVVADSLVDFTLAVARGIPSAWIYGGAIAFVGLYAALFGLGTAAYRTLYANR